MPSRHIPPLMVCDRNPVRNAESQLLARECDAEQTSSPSNSREKAQEEEGGDQPEMVNSKSTNGGGIVNAAVRKGIPPPTVCLSTAECSMLSSLSERVLDSDKVDALNKHLTDHMIEAMHEHIGLRSYGKPIEFRTPTKPEDRWHHDPQVKRERLSLKKATKLFNRYPSTEARQRVKRHQASLQQAVDMARQRYFDKFRNKLTNTQLLEALRKNSRAPISSRPLQVADRLITQPAEKAEVLRAFFDSTSQARANHYDEYVHQHLTSAESSGLAEGYNTAFSMEELEVVMDQLKNGKASGYDMVSTGMLKHTGPALRTCLLHLFNGSWSRGAMPEAWKQQLSFPLLKNTSIESPSASDYRPIALLSQIGKLMDHMVEIRLRSEAEKGAWIPQHQFGFRHKHSTTEALMHLFGHIEDGLAQHKTVSMVSIDLKKAFDTVSRTAVKAKLMQLGLKGHMLRWIDAFLTGRRGAVVIDGAMSRWSGLNEGVPQGAHLSPLLFLIAAIDLSQMLTSSFADDGQKVFITPDLKQRADDISTFLADFQGQANKLGLSVSVGAGKTSVCTYSYKGRHIPTDEMKVTFDNSIVPNVTQQKVLGVLLDNKLTFAQHHQRVVAKANLRANAIHRLMVSIAPTQDQYLQVYKSHVRAVCEYATMITVGNRRGRGCDLKGYERLQRNFLRRVLCASHRAGADALNADADVLPIQLRFAQLAAKHVTRTYHHQTTHCSRQEMSRRHSQLRPDLDTNRHTDANSIMGRCLHSSRRLRINTELLTQSPEHALAKGCKLPPIVCAAVSRITVNPKRTESLQEYEEAKRLVDLQYSRLIDNALEDGLILIHTDGSHFEGCTGAGVTIQDGDRTINKSEEICTFADNVIAEVYAALLALRTVSDMSSRQTDAELRAMLVTDSQYVLNLFAQPIRVTNSTPVSMIQDLREAAANFQRLQLLWVPSHCGIKQNEIADRLASKAMDRMHGRWSTYCKQHPQKCPPFINEAKVRPTITMGNRHVAQQCRRQHARLWQDCKYGSALRQVKPTPRYDVGLLSNTPRAVRRALTRLRHDEADLAKFVASALAFTGRSHRDDGCRHCPAIQEDRRHYLLYCPAYERARRTLLLTVGAESQPDEEVKIQRMLALADDQSRSEKATAVKALAKFLSSTGYFARRLRLHQVVPRVEGRP